MKTRLCVAFLAPCIAAADLAAAPAHYVSDFTGQCAAAGIEFAYADPNDAIPSRVDEPEPGPKPDLETDCLSCHVAHKDDDCMKCHAPHAVAKGSAGEASMAHGATFPQPTDNPRVGDIDGLSGASGDYYYAAASYLDADYLMGRVNAMFRTFEWVVSDEGVASLDEACRLSERQYVSALFPDDGKRYELRESKNQLGAKTVSTVSRVRDEASNSEDVRPNIATIGYGMFNADGAYFAEMTIGKNNTCYNVVTTGHMRLSYYEYDPASTDKLERNRGARMIGNLDYARTALLGPDWKTEIRGFGRGVRFSPEDVDWSEVGACSLVIGITGIYPLG